MVRVKEWLPDGSPVFSKDEDTSAAVPTEFYDDLIEKLTRSIDNETDGAMDTSTEVSARGKEDPMSLIHKHLLHAFSEVQVLGDVWKHLMTGKEPHQLLPQHLTIHPEDSIIQKQSSTMLAQSRDNNEQLLAFHQKTFKTAAESLRQEADRLTERLESVQHPFFKSFLLPLRRLNHPIHAHLRIPYYISPTGNAILSATIDPQTLQLSLTPEDYKSFIYTTVEYNGKVYSIAGADRSTSTTNDDPVEVANRQLQAARLSAKHKELFQLLCSEANQLAHIQQSSKDSIMIPINSSVTVYLNYGIQESYSEDIPEFIRELVRLSEWSVIKLWLQWKSERSLAKRQKLCPHLMSDGTNSNDNNLRILESLEQLMRLLADAFEFNSWLSQHSNSNYALEKRLWPWPCFKWTINDQITVTFLYNGTSASYLMTDSDKQERSLADGRQAKEILLLMNKH